MARLNIRKTSVDVYSPIYLSVPIICFFSGTSGSPPLLTMLSILISGRLTARAEDTILSHCIAVGSLLALDSSMNNCRSNCGQDSKVASPRPRSRLISSNQSSLCQNMSSSLLPATSNGDNNMNKGIRQSTRQAVLCRPPLLASCSSFFIPITTLPPPYSRPSPGRRMNSRVRYPKI